MLQHLVPLLPPAILFGAVYFFEECSASTLRRFLAWAVVSAASLRGIAQSPYHDPLANYMTGFFSSWYIVWSANLLLVKDLTALQRIEKQTSSFATVYIWQSLPSRNSWARFFWAVDLTLNFRAIGWNFSSRQSPHLPDPQTHSQTDIDSNKTQASGPKDLEISPARFLWRQVWRLLVSGIWFAGYPCLIRGGVIDVPAVIQLVRDYANKQGPGSLPDLLSVAITLYMFMDGIHATVSLVAVGLLGHEQWRYPAFFGPVKYLLSGQLQDLWGKFWHDLLKEGLLATARGALPWKKPRPLWSVIKIWACFILTGAIHASASYAVSREPLPSLYAGVFYCLQPVGILIQMTITGSVRSLLPKFPLTLALRRVLDFTVGLLWLYSCFPWISNDPALRQAIGTISPFI